MEQFRKAAISNTLYIHYVSRVTYKYFFINERDPWRNFAWEISLVDGSI